MYRKKKGRRKLVLSEKADKIKKPQSGKIIRKHSDNWSKKSIRGNGRDLLFRQGHKEKSFRVFKKGNSGSPNLQYKDMGHRTNYSIGNQKFLMNRPFIKNKWNREETLQSQYDISSDFIHSKENYNMYLNTKRNKIAPAINKMKKIIGIQKSERSLLESMRMSKRVKQSEDPNKYVTHPMVFIKRKNKQRKTGKVNVSKKLINSSRSNSNIQNKRLKNNGKQKSKIDSRSRKGSTFCSNKTKNKSKSPKTICKKKKKNINFNGGKKLLNTTGNQKPKSINSQKPKKDYKMDVFVSLTHKKGNHDQYQSEINKGNGKYKGNYESILKQDQNLFRKRNQRKEKNIMTREANKKLDGNSKQNILQNFLKKSDQVEKFMKHMDHAKKIEKEDLMVLITESSKETSQNISSKKESSLEKFRIEDLVEKTNETRKLMEIFREQKSGIFENKRQTEDKINSVFLKLLNLMEQERVKALKVVEDQFHSQKQNIFEIEKQLVMKEQTMQNIVR